MSTGSDNKLIKPLIILALIIGIGYFFYTNFERYEYEDKDYNQEYLRNDFFVLKKYLESLGINTQVSRNSADVFIINDSYSNLVLLESDLSYSTASNTRIKDWIKAGGTLISTVSHNPDEGEENFFAEFDLVNEDLRDDYSDAIGCYTHNYAFIDCDNQDVLTTSANYKLLASNRHGNAYIELSYGDGRLVLFSHAFPYDNRNIVGDDEYYIDDSDLGFTGKDNAYFFSTLINPDRQGKTLIIYDAHRSNLLAAIWRNAKLSVILFLSLVALFLWSMIQRFGPFKRPELESQQDLKQHLQACANYSWEQNRLSQHVQQLRESLLRQIQSKTGKTLPKEPQALHQLVKEYFELMKIDTDPKRLEYTIFGNLPQDEASLMNLSRQLQSLWSKL